MGTMQTLAIVEQLKSSQEDFEWYPTTSDMIETVANAISQRRKSKYDELKVLDCGAGDGRVLAQLSDALENIKTFAIEKARPHLDAIQAEHCIIGTDFTQQTLIDKPMDIIFCNPPYSEYHAWASKIINEANAQQIYLILPSRWENTDLPALAKRRGAEVSILSESDFLNAERQARARVQIICLSFKKTSGAFEQWFDEHFQMEEAPKTNESLSDTLSQNGDLIQKRGLLTMLDDLYQRDMANLMASTKAITQVDPVLLKELGVERSTILEGLKEKIASLKHQYWRELFDRLGCLTSRLCTKQRQNFLIKLHDNMAVDFNIENANAIIQWALKQAHLYADQQIIEVVENTIASANAIAYKSNQRVFTNQQWRYRHWDEESIGPVALDYRFVLTNWYGIDSSFSNQYLKQAGVHYLNDLITIGTLLGFDTANTQRIEGYYNSWQAGEERTFYALLGGKEVELFRARPYKNGNMHIKLNQKLALRLNVAFGKLKGWLHSAEQAADELNESLADTQTAWQAQHRLGFSSVLMALNHDPRP